MLTVNYDLVMNDKRNGTSNCYQSIFITETAVGFNIFSLFVLQCERFCVIYQSRPWSRFRAVWIYHKLGRLCLGGKQLFVQWWWNYAVYLLYFFVVFFLAQLANCVWREDFESLYQLVHSDIACTMSCTISMSSILLRLRLHVRRCADGHVNIFHYEKRKKYFLFFIVLFLQSKLNTTDTTSTWQVISLNTL